MKKLFFLIFCASQCLSVIAQKVELELKSFPIEVAGREFFIQRVLDSRRDTSKVGWSVLNKETKGYVYDLKDGLKNQLDLYFSKNLKKDSGQAPLVMNIVGLIVQEKAKTMREGTASARVEFYEEKDGLYGKVFETSFLVEAVSEFGKDIYSTHERRVRLVLAGCLKNLASSKWKETKPDFVTMNELRQESYEKDSLSTIIQDSVALFRSNEEQKMAGLILEKISYSRGIFPSFVMYNNKKRRTLWPYKVYFSKMNDKMVNKSFVDYKSKYKLTFFVSGIGAALVGLSFLGDSMEESGIPNLSLLVPGAVFMGFSIPIYLKSQKLAKSTVDKYNLAIQSK